MSMSTYQTHIQNTNAFQGKILGHLCWYSVPEETISHDTVFNACKKHGLEFYAPQAPRPPDVFRRACKDAGRRIGRKEDPQRFTYEFKSIDHDDQQIFVKLIRETVDAATNKGIDWARMANITFQRSSQLVDVVELPDIDQEGRAVIADLKSIFNAENGRINSAHIRRMIQQVLHDCMATAVRPSGGIYFVTEAHAPKLMKLTAVLNSLPNGTSMHPLPLIDTSDQRSMLKAAVETELASEIDRHLATVTDVLKAGKPISVDRYTKLTAELHRAGRKGNEYATLLSQKLSVFETRKAVASDVLVKLAALVESD